MSTIRRRWTRRGRHWVYRNQGAGMSLEGRVAIVTGAAQGIGRAIAETLAHAGADIVVADLDPARSADAVAAVEKAGRKALNIKVNVADANDTKAMADQVSKEWGKI